MTSRAIPIHLSIGLGDITASPATISFAAPAKSLPALADLAGAEEVTGFTAELRIRKWRRRGLAVEAELAADLVQMCVVTLEPIKTRIEEHFEARFLSASERRDDTNRPGLEIEIDPDEADPPEYFEGSEVDLGPVLVEHFLLGVDPYPRAEGAEVEDAFSGDGRLADEDDGSPPSPFAALAQLKSSAEGNDS